MILVQNYIYESVQKERSAGKYQNIDLSSFDMFPTLNSVADNSLNIKESKHVRNIIEETNRHQHAEKEKLYSQPINEYFYQKPTYEITDKEKIWNNYFDTLYVTTSVF